MNNLYVYFSDSDRLYPITPYGIKGVILNLSLTNCIDYDNDDVSEASTGSSVALTDLSYHQSEKHVYFSGSLTEVKDPHNLISEEDRKDYHFKFLEEDDDFKTVEAIIVTKENYWDEIKNQYEFNDEQMIKIKENEILYHHHFNEEAVKHFKTKDGFFLYLKGNVFFKTIDGHILSAIDIDSNAAYSLMELFD